MVTYLNTRQLAERLGYSPRTIRSSFKDVVFLEGVHYFRPYGRMRPLYIWDVIERDMQEHSKENGLRGVLPEEGEA
jgi:predicted ArsR family transcriptional regulator